jgi:hypothetical protein
VIYENDLLKSLLKRKTKKKSKYNGHLLFFMLLDREKKGLPLPQDCPMHHHQQN